MDKSHKIKNQGRRISGGPRLSGAASHFFALLTGGDGSGPAEELEYGHGEEHPHGDGRRQEHGGQAVVGAGGKFPSIKALMVRYRDPPGISGTAAVTRNTVAGHFTTRAMVSA